MTPLDDNQRPALFVVGDHGVVAEALRALIEGAGFDLAGTRASLPEAARALVTTPATAALVDLPLGEGEAHQWANRLYRAQPALRAAALRAGPTTWLFSVSTPAATRRMMLGRIGGGPLVSLLYDAVRRGDATFHELLRRIRPVAAPAPTPLPAAEAEPASTKLTRRERDLLRFLSRGVTANRQLATALGVSENTVKYHLRNLLAKMGVHRRAEAIALALRGGLVRMEPLPRTEAIGPPWRGTTSRLEEREEAAG
jgi:DNA-binding NarL/FixJ family response regulator